jgi:hypothetical protein
LQYQIAILLLVMENEFVIATIIFRSYHVFCKVRFGRYLYFDCVFLSMYQHYEYIACIVTVILLQLPICIVLTDNGRTVDQRENENARWSSFYVQATCGVHWNVQYCWRSIPISTRYCNIWCIAQEPFPYVCVNYVIIFSAPRWRVVRMVFD